MSKKAQPTYSEAIEEIEQIIASIESNEFEIDELSDKVKRVSGLIKYCKEKLHATELEVNNVLKQLDENNE